MKIVHTFLLPLLIPISWFYGSIIWLRNYLFNIGLLISVSFDIPVISVGNITTGGTGKTPMVIYLARLFKKNGFKPGIVSRGYGRNSRGLKIVHDGNSLLEDVNKAGDEPYLLGKILKTIPIIVSENRIFGIKKFQDNFQVDIIIMDDGFQHRKVKRNMDIVMISANDKPSDYHFLPWGRLREPLYCLKRAQCIIYTRTKRFQNPYLHNILNPHVNNSPIASIMQPILMKIDNAGYHKSLPTDAPAFAFCGIGNADYFFKIVKEKELNIVGKRIFRNHQKYNNRLLQNLSTQIQSSNCRIVVTTEKDIVKIPAIFINKFIFYVIKIDIVFEDDTVVLNKIKSILPILK